MAVGKFVLSHILEFVPIYEFNKCVDRYQGNHRTRSFSCYDQFICMAFAQLTNRESLRDIEICLRSMSNKLYHAGLRGKISRSTLSDANEKRDWRIYADFAKVLMDKAQILYAYEKLNVDIGHALYALDASTIDLCLSVFPWAKYMKTKSAVKLHALLDLRGNIPSVIIITDGKGSDVEIMDQICWQAGAIYLMDRAYTDFTRLYKITTSAAFFVTRLRKRISWKRVYSHKVNRETGVICDQTVALQYRKSRQDYPAHLRRIKYYDKESGKNLEFLTNNFELPALIIAQLYKQRWQVELFFKWIKQHLRIKEFYGTTENAVKTQIWIAVTIYLLIAILKKTLKLEQSLYTLSQIFSLTLFEKTKDISDFVNQNYKNYDTLNNNQLNLFDS